MTNTPKSWHIIIEGRKTTSIGAFLNCYVNTKHLGDAIKMAESIAKRKGLRAAFATEARSINFRSEIAKFDVIERIDSKAYILPSLSMYEIHGKDAPYPWPHGIIKSTEDSNLDTELIREGFYLKNEENNISFEIFSTRTNYLRAFSECIDFVPNPEVFEIFVSPEWTGMEKGIWQSNSFSKTKIEQFLKKHRQLILENGWVACVLRGAASEPTVGLSTHKSIKLYTASQTLAKTFRTHLTGLGHKRLRNNYWLEFGYHHYHYSPGNHIEPKHVINLLRANKFRLQ